MSTFSQQWDPKAILYQIVTIQCCYYLVLGGLIVIADLLFNCFSQLRLDQLFDPSILSFHTPLGLASMTAFVANSIITGLVLVKVVEKAKRVLDFSVTTFIFHLTLVIFYSGFPLSWIWWALHIACFVLQTLLAEIICIRREMKQIQMAQATTV